MFEQEKFSKNTLQIFLSLYKTISKTINNTTNFLALTTEHHGRDFPKNPVQSENVYRMLLYFR